MVINTSFDFRTDAGGKDPDVYSPTLRQYHKLLWSKSLPNGRLFDLDDTVRGAYLHHRSALGEYSLSSDSVIPTFTRWGFAKAHPELYAEAENQAFMAISYTIGGMMVFPGNRIQGKRTINQARGCLKKIADRFDLTVYPTALRTPEQPSRRDTREVRRLLRVVQKLQRIRGFLPPAGSRRRRPCRRDVLHAVR